MDNENKTKKRLKRLSLGLKLMSLTPKKIRAQLGWTSSFGLTHTQPTDQPKQGSGNSFWKSRASVLTRELTKCWCFGLIGVRVFIVIIIIIAAVYCVLYFLLLSVVATLQN